MRNSPTFFIAKSIFWSVIKEIVPIVPIILKRISPYSTLLLSFTFLKSASLIRYLLKCSLGYSAALWLIVMLFPRLLATLFAQDSAFLDYTAWALRIFMATSVVMGIQIACQQTFIAIGNAKTSLFLAIYRKIILLIPLIYILPYFFENKVMAVFLAEPVADVIAVTTTLILFVWQFKKALQELRE